MDSFYNIRLSASALNEKLVSNGVNPLDPMALVEAAVIELDLELIWLPPGNSALKNSRALYDDQSGMICCENIGDAASRALLVAHEIGHVILHAGSSICDIDDINPSSALEAAPIGLQRVEDYGAKERQELQANVFAREVLLPRTMVKKLHIDDGLASVEIISQTGLPAPVVRQQLFDALLLPDEKEQSPERTEYTPIPDASQDRAVAHRGTPFQLQAGPGTGKTRTLIKRIKALIKDGVDPSSILIMTFSNRAAGELSERLIASVPDQAARIWVGTFHAFGLDLVRRHYDRLDLSSNPQLFDRSDAISVLEEILPTLPLIHYRNLWDPAMVLRDIIGAFSRAKDELIDPIQYRKLAEAMLATSSSEEKDRIAAEKCLEIAQIYTLYERAIRERGAVDFGDLIMRPALLLENDDAVRTATQLRHRHILVDEYQDINRASARLLKAVAGAGTNLWVVGDARQSIYRFRGASSANMVKFSDDYTGAIIDKLDINYRSKSEIVKSFVSVALQMGASNSMLPLSLNANQGAGGGKPQISRYDTLEDEEAGVAASVLNLKNEGVKFRDQAVLCRSNRRLNEIASALETRGIPVLHLGSLFERNEVRDLLALLSLAVDPFGDALIRIGAMPRYNLSLQDVFNVSRHIRTQDQPALSCLGALSTIEGVSKESANSLNLLAKDFQGISANISAWDLVSIYLLDRTDLARQLALATTVTDRMRAVAIWQFLNFIREQSLVGSGTPIQRTLDRVRQLVLLAEERDLRQVPAAALNMDAVRLMTVHGSKGLEFEAVHVPGLTVASFPSSNRGQRCAPPAGMIDGDGALSVSDSAKQEHRVEEECLFFVAISRAKIHLRLHLARKQPNGGNRNPSHFLDWIPSHLVQENIAPDRMPLPEGIQALAPINVSTGGNWKLSDSRLTSYEKCPLRFFYTHFLGLGSARKVTAFSQTHDCLYDLLRWLKNERLISNPTQQDTITAFDKIWLERGPHDHGFAEDYRHLALRLIKAAVRSGAGFNFKETEPLSVQLSNGEIFVEPTELAERSDGTVIMRRVRTGYCRSDEYDRLEYTLYLLAAHKNHSGAVVQAVHLTDETEDFVSITQRKIDHRVAKCESFLSDMNSGWFPTKIDSVICPRCPHFFICTAVPGGDLTLT